MSFWLTNPDFIGDIGNQNRSTLTAMASISNADFAPLILDGLLDLSFLTSLTVTDNVTISGNISFDEVSAVPVPAAVWLFGTALIGLVGLSRRRKVA